MEACAPTGEPQEVDTLVDGQVLAADTVEVLPLAAADMLAMLTRVSADGGVLGLGRSYNGHPWEAVRGLEVPLEFDCTAGGGSCSVALPVAAAAGDVFQIAYIEGSGDVSTETALARFLMQATFGQSRASIAEIAAMGSDPEESVAAWLGAQMAMPASLHRAEFRRHNNPPMAVPLQGTGASQPCSANALWQRHAVSRLDEGETMHFEETTAGYNLLIDGEVIIP